jgi:[acyl-carrier-protein] S-malonyltransferase
MSNKIALFPGQGSQYVGMAQALAGAYEPARALLAQADAILGFKLSEIMAAGPEEALKATENTQPALFVGSMMVWTYLADQGAKFDYAAGHSLGEYSALCAAGALSFEDALKLVRLRGELMAQAGTKAPGAMSAVMGMEDADLEAFLNAGDFGVVVPANFNCPGQIVISGEREAVAKAGDAIAATGKKVVPLPVSGAFHSPLMKFAEEGLAAGIAQTTFAVPSIPVIANVTASPVTDPEEIKSLLVRQLTAPVRWTASMQKAMELGVNYGVEVGAKSVLMGLARKISRDLKVSPVETIEEFEKIKENF